MINAVWSYARGLRDQSVSYADYVEQITYLLFLKMDEERAMLIGEASSVPKAWCWARLAELDGEALESHYRNALAALAKAPGLIGA
jgi:type I restriction enzyme M protein